MTKIEKLWTIIAPAAAVAVVIMFLPNQSASQPNPVQPSPIHAPEPDSDSDSGSAPTVIECEGLAQSVFDTTVRIRNRDGTGSGSIIADLGDSYEIETNHHVAERRGTRNVIDVWQGGDLAASVPRPTEQSWFEDGKSKDVAILRVPKSVLRSKLSVVPTAPPGYSKTIKAGDMVWMIGCSDGRWPRARCGNVLRVDRGLIYYDPKSIGGDSGSGVYSYDESSRKWYCIGRTAWAIRDGSRWVGLAMTSDRVRAIREGRVSTGWQLPTGARPLDEIDFDGIKSTKSTKSEADLPNTAVRLDLMRMSADATGIDPEPIDTGLIFNRDDGDGCQLPKRPKNIREGIGAGVYSLAWFAGFAVAVFVVTIAVLVILIFVVFRSRKKSKTNKT